MTFNVLKQKIQAKHAPIGPKGCTFLLSDNDHLDHGKAIRGEPNKDKLELLIVDTKGDIHIHKFPDKAQAWDDEDWIKHLNKWRMQSVQRTFRKDRNAKLGKKNRSKWSLIEKEYMANLIRRRVKRNLENCKSILSTGDWQKIASKQNARFVGTEVQIGEQMLTGKIAKSNYPIDKRSAVAMRNMFDKLPDLVEMVNNLLGAGEVEKPGGDANIASSSDEEAGSHIIVVDDDADGEEDEESGEEDMDEDGEVGVPRGEMGSLLLESSDDEMDGQLPSDQ